MVRRNNLYANVDWITIGLWMIMVIFGWMNIYSANIMNGDGCPVRAIAIESAEVPP